MGSTSQCGSHRVPPRCLLPAHGDKIQSLPTAPSLGSTWPQEEAKAARCRALLKRLFRKNPYPVDDEVAVQVLVANDAKTSSELKEKIGDGEYDALVNKVGGPWRA